MSLTNIGYVGVFSNFYLSFHKSLFFIMYALEISIRLNNCTYKNTNQTTIICGLDKNGQFSVKMFDASIIVSRHIFGWWIFFTNIRYSLFSTLIKYSIKVYLHYVCVIEISF